jgi:hypothetical protein
MRIIPDGYSKAPDLHHLQVFDVLLREHSLTRAARELDVTQPALSKTLAQLRQYFDDPLFVRVASRMELTAKALQLATGIAPTQTMSSVICFLGSPRSGGAATCIVKSYGRA